MRFPILGRPSDRTGSLQVAVCAACLAFTACAAKPDHGYQGYAEGEFVLVASPYAGELTALHVQRGAQVAAGAPLFELERDQDLAAQREAQHKVASAQAQVKNLAAARRPLERKAAEEDVAQAEAAVALSRRELQRAEKLIGEGFVSQARVDEARSTYERDMARLAQAQAQARLYGQSIGRNEEVAVAQAQVEAARAALDQTRWRVEQKAQEAPQAGLVYDTFFVQGEWVPAGRPVVSLLPPANIKVRFFVPETAVGAIKVGQRITVSCDGCGAPIPATVSYVSAQPEYTPPVIYSRQERAKLVFLLEARPDPDQATRLKPGQPVDVRLQP